MSVNLDEVKAPVTGSTSSQIEMMPRASDEVKFKMRHFICLPVVIGLMLISGCASPGGAVTTQPTPSLTATQPASPAAPQPVETGTGGEESSGLDLSGLPSLLPTLADMAPRRTPEPTPTPDVLAKLAKDVAEIVGETGLAGRTLLWLKYEDWINLGLSLLVVLAGYLIGTWLIRWLFPRLVRRTETVLDDRLLQASGSEMRWLAVVIVLRFATNRLTFVDANVKSRLTDIYFLLIVVLTVRILWRLIDLAAQQATVRAKRAGHRREAESLVELSVWGSRLVVIIFTASVSLNYFGVNITGIAVLLGVIGLAFSMAGRDLVTDIIAGAIILIDHPYRIGDRIDLPGIDSWGDVVDIGMRSTRILTLDNRMVIVPNSEIGKDRIVNYSYPDPSYYDMSDVVIAYDNDVEQVGQLLIDTVRKVKGVQTEREIDALLMELSENQMLFRVGWWIESYNDMWAVRDRVNRAVIQALKEAGVVLPYRKGRLDLATQTEGKMFKEENDGGN